MTDVEPYREPVDSWVDVVAPVAKLADYIARTDFVPKAYRARPEAVAAAILTGRELGLGPLTSLRGIDVIEGRVSLSAQMIAARVLAAGHRLAWKTSTDERCTVTIERGDNLSQAEATWTMRDAQRAGLAGKSNWQKYPRAMLRARALTEAAAMACPDVLLGLEAADEPTDTHPGGATTTVQVTPGNETRPADQAPTTVGSGDTQPAGRETSTPTMQPAETIPPDLITPAQMRMIGALIGKWETRAQRRLDPDQRRALIAQMAGLDELDSAKHLTRAQASTAIDQLTNDLGNGDG